MTNSERLLTVREAAEKIGVSERVIRGAIHKGRLEALKVGWVQLIDPDDLEIYRVIRRR